MAVSVTDLAVHYRRDSETIRAVDGVSFDVHPGEVLVLLGPNGAGKTSTIETLEGYRKPTSGRVRVNGLDPIADHHRLMSQVGIMLQVGGVHPSMRVIEALRLYASFYDHPIQPELLVERLGLGSLTKSTWRQLSGGEQQRLSLALALIGRPEVVFLDEPTSGVDVSGRQLVRETITSLRDDGVAVLLTTHELAEAERLADRVVIIDCGRVAATGTLDELMNTGGAHGIYFSAPGALDVGSLSNHLGISVVELRPGEYFIDHPSTPEMVASLTSWLADNGLALGDLRAARHSLEDVFLRITNQHRATKVDL